MANIFQKLFVFLIIGLLASSCSKDEELLVVNVTEEFELELIEKLSPSSNEFKIIITTVHSQNCINAELSLHNFNAVGRVDIKINGVNDPVDCVSGVGPVSADIPLNLYQGETTINVSLSDELTNSGVITINKDNYQIRFNTDHGIKYSSEAFHRIPNLMVWGYMSSVNEDTNTVIPDLISGLASSHELEDAALQRGNFGYFSIDNDEVFNDHNIPAHITNPYQFIFSNLQSVDDLRQAIENIKLDYPQLKLRLTTSDGDIIS